MTPSPSAETPQQPELTPDDRHRIETEVIRITGGYTKESSDTYLSCFKAAEYATLHERADTESRIPGLEGRIKRQVERIKELEALVSDMFDWCKCGYVHNTRMPIDGGLIMLAKAKSIRDKKEVTPEDIREWLH